MTDQDYMDLLDEMLMLMADVIEEDDDDPDRLRIAA